MSAAPGTTVAVAAIDLGATSGRVMVGHVGPGDLRIRQVARFANGPVALPDGLHWNTQGLYRAALDGLRDAVTWESSVGSVGIDSWAVDYALLRAGRTLGEPFHYRDERNEPAAGRVHETVPFTELYARNGLQFLPFNTLYQLAAEDPGVLGIADRMLLVPDLLAFWLTGREVAERTNASTTGLLDVATREWDLPLVERLGLDAALLPELVEAGTAIGPLRAEVAAHTRMRDDAQVVAIGSHDTASAVVAAPMRETGGAYISCGTWGLVGVETERPVLTDAAREANFTNEGGVDGRTRFLHNVMGLWLLSESIREWERGGDEVPGLHVGAVELGHGLRGDADAPRDAVAGDGLDAVLGAVQDALDEGEPFEAPGDMPARIAQWCERSGQRVPSTPAQITRTIIESLAQAFADAVATASSLASQPVDTIHMVGGGALNALLCQRTADRSGLRVVAGPVEATALGNVLVQGRALGAAPGSLESMRELVRTAFEPRTYEPRHFDNSGG